MTHSCPTRRSSDLEAREAAILCRELKANSMVGEKKYGGDIYAMELARPAGIGQQLRVYARPARRARNPYPGMLADALVAPGVPVSELSYSRHPVPGKKKAKLFFQGTVENRKEG